MATTPIDKPSCTHREQTPVRTCMKCGCYLRSYHDTPQCEPCGTPEWELTDDEVIRLIAEVPTVPRRRLAFEALAEMHER